MRQAQKPAPTPVLHDLTTASRMLGISRATLFRLLASGQIDRVKIGHRTLLAHAEIERFAATGTPSPTRSAS